MFEQTLVLIPVHDRILLGEKLDGKFSGLVNGPGGGREPGEGPVSCVIRETWEELGIELWRDQLQHICVLNCYVAGQLNCRVDVFLTNHYGGTPITTQSMRPLWAFLNRIPYDRMHDGDRYWMPRALGGERFNVNLFYETPGKNLLAPPEFLPFDPYDS